MKAPNEKHLEDWLFEDISRLAIPLHSSFYKTGTAYRQVKMRRGVLDLLFIEEDSMTIVELKKDSVDDAALQQILRYIGDLKDTWEDVTSQIPCESENNLFNTYPKFGGLNIQGILIGHGSNNKTLAAAHGANIWVFGYDYDGVSDYDLDWIFHDTTYDLDNPLEYSDISDAMFRMGRNYVKKHSIGRYE